MARTTVALQSFNKGVISSLGLARTDLGNRIATSAEVQTNWMPRALGSMMLRTGLEYIGNTYSNSKTLSIEFVFSLSDVARVELSPNGTSSGYASVWVDDEVISYTNVGAAITNQQFATDLTGWTDADEAGAVSSWVSGEMSLKGLGEKRAIRYQLVDTTTLVGNPVRISIYVSRGEVDFSIGTTLHGDEIFEKKTFGRGVYSIEFTPTSAATYIEFSSKTEYASLVGWCEESSTGRMLIPTVWGSDDLPYVRKVQSGDVIFTACKGLPLQKIVRYNPRSWAVVDDVSNDGPLKLVNATKTTITASALSGDIVLTASEPTFKSEHVGALYSLISANGQTVEKTLTAQNQFSDPIFVTGILEGRTFNITITGTWVATIYLQYSLYEVGPWVDVTSYTTNQAIPYLDNKDNQELYYRVGIKTGGYTSGTAVATLTFTAGSITGFVRIVEYTSATSVKAIVLKNLGGTGATDTWSEGAWSAVAGYPSAITIHEGRKWLAGKDKYWASVSGTFNSFDDLVTGDSGTISKSIGSGAVDTIQWMVSAERLLVGAQLAEITIRSSSLDEPLTPSSSSPKNTSTQGSAAVAAINIDGNAVFVQRCGHRIYSMLYDTATYGYGTQDLTSLSNEICGDGIVQLAVQRQPDTRMHAVRADGKVAVLIFDKGENVNCWVLVETDGIIEDACVLPGTVEDLVYYTVKRVINGSTVRFHEKFALESECQGGDLNKQADAFSIYDGSPTTTITGAGHLEQETVVVWADGKYVGEKTVVGGGFTLAVAASKVMYGLPYSAKYKSTKLAYGSQKGSALTQMKRINNIGLIMKNTHNAGLRYGRSFDKLSALPRKFKGIAVTDDQIYSDYDESGVSFGGSWDTDHRLCLQADAPKPCTILAAVIEIEEVDS